MSTSFKSLNISARFLRSLVCGVLLSGIAMVSSADDTVAASGKTEAASNAVELTTADVSAFIDGMVPIDMERNNIAGAVVAVVKDNQVIFAKGYGYSDVENKVPVTADNTLFRIGSISKLFTWTALMQLVEQGKVDLDTDVNHYLDFAIPDAFGKPITIRHLMTHTAGFEETLQGMWVPEGQKMIPLHDYLAAHIPARIFEPGKTGAYSNYGAALAGYIVERVSGEGFDNYIDRHILHPLNMSHTTFTQPLPEVLKPLMSKGYELGSGKSKPFEIIEAAPAGSISASAMDMTRFMMMHLNQGSLAGQVVLQPQTTELMYSPQYEPVAGDHAMVLGFYDQSRNGHHIISHGGDTLYFHSDMYLILDAHVGLFVSQNSSGENLIRRPLFQKFMNRYFPAQKLEVASASDANTQIKVPKEKSASDAAIKAAEDLAGNYLPSRRSDSTALYLTALLSELVVSPNDDGTFCIDEYKGLNKQPIRWHQQAPGIWEDPSDTERKLYFMKNEAGAMEMSSGHPFNVYTRVSTLQRTELFLASAGIALTILLLTLIAWPCAALVRKHYGAAPMPIGEQRTTRTGVRRVFAISIGFWIVYLVVMGYGMANLDVLMGSSFSNALRVIQVAALIQLLGSLLSLPVLFKTARAKGWWWWSRTHYALTVLASLLTTWFILNSHLLTLRVNY